ITGGLAGVKLNNAAGLVANYGTIIGTAAGGAGVVALDGGTIIDAGAIMGGTSGAVAFHGTSAGLLILRHGYALTGGVHGSASASDQVELQGTSPGNAVTATYSNLSLANVGTVGFAPGAGNYATLRITNNASLPHTITNFSGIHDTIDLAALAYVSGSTGTHFDTVTNKLSVTAGASVVA